MQPAEAEPLATVRKSAAAEAKQAVEDRGLTRAQAGESEVSRELIRAHQDASYALALRFLGVREGAQERAQDAFIVRHQLIAGLPGVYVRSDHFPHDDEYSRAAVKTVMARLAAPDRTPIVSVRQRRHGSGDSDVNIDILRRGAQTKAVTIVAQKPLDLTIVNIVGSIDLARLEHHQGQFGVPKVGVTEKAREPAGRTRPAPQTRRPIARISSRPLLVVTTPWRSV